MTELASNFSVAEAIDQAPFHRLLKLDFVSQDVETGQLRLGVNLRPELMRSKAGDGLHGGAIASLIDVAAFFAVRLAAGRGGATVGLSVDYLRAVHGPRAEAVARVVKTGRTQAVADVEVFDEAALVAVGRVRFAMKDAG